MVTSKSPPSVDLSKLPPVKLRDLMRRYQEQGFPDLAAKCLDELGERGAARGDDFRHLRWNQQAVSETLRPFSEVSKQVRGSIRTAFTEAGGTKIGRKKEDPDRNWIDTYTAIKTDKINAAFVCYVPKPGDEPTFQLHVGGSVRKTFTFDQLDAALVDWRLVAHEAEA